TDHSKRVTMALGLDAKRLREQWRAIDEWNTGARGFTILKSVELDILETGKLDLPDDVLAEADYVVATIHYGTNQTERQLTRRLVGAAEHRWIDAIGHPTGRRLGKREPYRLDFDALARACAGAGCLLELNGHPERMDLPDTLAAAAKQHGVRFVLSTDSHQPNNLPFMKYAVDLARRAGLAAPTATASARARTTRASRARFTRGSSLESRSPRICLQNGGNTTAAATTGPASGPRPASSRPATSPLPPSPRATQCARSRSS